MRSLFNIIIISLIVLFSGFLILKESPISKTTDVELSKEANQLLPPFLTPAKKTWADSVLKTMTPEQRIGQLFMVAAYSNKDKTHQEAIEKLIKEQHIGGLIFFQGAPHKQATLTNSYQAASKVPLMVSIDGEWGLAMRLDSTHKFPKQMTLGAVQDDTLIYEMGKEMAAHCKRIGIHVNLAPVADINNNALNPVINYRSFGEDKYKVTKKCLSYMNGMQDHGIIANAKHFPGHGDTDSDSHKTLPIINHDLARLDSLELYPFKQLINNGLGSMMVAHLYIPSLDDTPNQASTLSKKIVTNLLKDELHFEGLIFTDALNMKGVSKYYAPGKVDLAALLAGNDVLLFSEDVPRAIVEIKKAVEEGLISQREIDTRCRKILMAKKWCGLDTIHPIKLTSLTKDLNPKKAAFLNQKLYEEAITVVRNENEIIPLTGLGKRTIASVTIGMKPNKHNYFDERADLYCRMNAYSYTKNMDSTAIEKSIEELQDYNTILLTIHGMNQRPKKNFGLTQSTLSLIQTLANDKSKQVILTILGNPYALKNVTALDQLDGVVVTYEDREITEQTAATLIFGGIASKGKLPVSISNKYPAGLGIVTRSPIRFKYTHPEELGIQESDLKGIESIVKEGLKEGAYPGCQILVAKDGKVFYHRSFGNHTYAKNSKKVENTDIYDLASITKIASSTASLMRLQSQRKINVDSTLNTYLHDMVDTSAYKDIKLKQMLTHQAGFVAWIPFYFRTLKKGNPDPRFYNVKQTPTFSNRVASDLYIKSSVRDSIFKRILSTEVSARKKYKYSDLGYYFINEIINRETKMTQDQYVEENFYKSLGLDNIGYNPRDKWDITRVPPTEDDKTFRKQLIHADVHDQGSAMLGGVCGHAGLFSNANDLAVMMQMMLNYGTYGGERYFDESVGKYFTSSPYLANGNRRGIGFDKPVRAGGSGPTCSKCASSSSFGHSGFTGTLTWADPSSGLVYVFLSNRIYPDATNRKLIKMSSRTRIMQVIYDAIKKADDK